MRLMSWDPFRELEDLRRMTDALLSTITAPRYRRRLEYPPLDVLESDEEFVVIANLPGVPKDQIHISVLGQALTIEGERPVDEDASHRYVRRERGYGKFRRTIEFQTAIQADKVKARYQDGVLSISVPKAESARPKQITVHAEE